MTDSNTDRPAETAPKCAWCANDASWINLVGIYYCTDCKAKIGIGTRFFQPLTLSTPPPVAEEAEPSDTEMLDWLLTPENMRMRVTDEMDGDWVDDRATIIAAMKEQP